MDYLAMFTVGLVIGLVFSAVIWAASEPGNGHYRDALDYLERMRERDDTLWKGWE